MTSFNPDYFIHAANGLLIVAYSVRDILWLRLFAVASSLISLPYFILQPTPQRAPIAWTACFAGLNLIQSFRLYLERRPVKLTPDEQEVRRLAFADLPARKVLQLVGLGSWTTAAPGERLIEHGTPATGIALVLRGKVRVSKDGQVLGELGQGDIVGSALVLSGAPAEVDAVTWSRCVRCAGTWRRCAGISKPIRSPGSAFSGRSLVTWPESCCGAWARPSVVAL